MIYKQLWVWEQKPYTYKQDGVIRWGIQDLPWLGLIMLQHRQQNILLPVGFKSMFMVLTECPSGGHIQGANLSMPCLLPPHRGSFTCRSWAITARLLRSGGSCLHITPSALRQISAVFGTKCGCLIREGVSFSRRPHNPAA
jgi:hypothetical protein